MLLRGRRRRSRLDLGLGRPSERARRGSLRCCLLRPLRLRPAGVVEARRHRPCGCEPHHASRSRARLSVRHGVPIVASRRRARAAHGANSSSTPSLLSTHRRGAARHAPCDSGAKNGVEPQSQTVWRQSDCYGVPRIVVSNKMDKLGASFVGAVASIPARLGAVPVPVQIPVGEKAEHRGVIDLIRMRAVLFEDPIGATFLDAPIPDELAIAQIAWPPEAYSRLGIPLPCRSIISSRRSTRPSSVIYARGPALSRAKARRASWSALGGVVSIPISWISPPRSRRIFSWSARTGAPAWREYGLARCRAACFMATHGRSGASGVLLGSQAREVVQRARQPVLLVPSEGR